MDLFILGQPVCILERNEHQYKSDYQNAKHEMPRALARAYATAATSYSLIISAVLSSWCF